MTAYYLFASLFMYGYLADIKESFIGHHLLMLLVAFTVGWAIFPIVLGDKIRKL
jgi:hypothetical protein